MAATELDLQALEAKLLSALRTGDQTTQMHLYRQVGEHKLRNGSVDEGCFLLTNAWVLALSVGDAVEHELHSLLAQHGRVPL